MSPSSSTNLPPAGLSSPRRLWLGFALLALVVCGAYWPGLGGDFIFDDPSSIEHNPSLRQLGSAWRPPADSGLTVSGRPLLNFSLAVNYAAGGLDPRGYRLTNLALHFGSALLAFGLLRRLLRAPRVSLPAVRNSADSLAIAITALWTLHPIVTIAVTYVVQRAESLAAGLILLGLYSVVRSIDSATHATRAGWGAAAIGAAAIGATAKETTAVLPLLALLLDRTLFAENAREIWRRRGWIYVGMVLAAWPLLAWFVVDSGGRGGTAGFGSLVAPGEYLLGQGWALTVYLSRVLWPHPLIFDYGGELVASLAQIVTGMVVTGLLAVVTVWGGVKNRAWAGLGLSWFLLLAPSSSFVPVATQFMSEHRVYLPSLVVLTALVLALHRWLGRGVFWIAPVLALSLAGATAGRNYDYRSEIAIWEDTVAKRPGNSRAHNNLGFAYIREARLEEAEKHFRIAAALEPERAKAHYDLGNVLLQLNRLEEAESALGRALAKQPDYPIAATKLANLRFMRGDVRGAANLYLLAVEGDDTLGEAHANLASALGAQGDGNGAVRHGRRALELEPTNLTYSRNLAWTLATAADPRARDPAAALTLLQTELAEDSPALSTLRTAAVAHGALGNWTEAQRLLGSALMAAGASPETALLRRQLREELEYYKVQARRHGSVQ